jgi:hypothetical protein
LDVWNGKRKESACDYEPELILTPVPDMAFLKFLDK